MPPEEPETAIRAHVRSGDIRAAADLAIRTFGPGLLGFLRAIAHEDALAGDAFAIASEQMWQALPKFRWEAQLRTWYYQLGRNALHKLRADPRRRRERNLSMELIGSVEVVQRSTTAVHHKSEAQRALAALRETLEPADLELLILRLDRNMSWRQVAETLCDDERESPEPSQHIDARATLLRKRFQRIKAQLRQLATERGILTSPSE